MARSKSSQSWLKEHFSDPFVRRAQKEGMRSRAAYKLDEILGRDGLVRPGMLVVDLGAAPGGWSQLVAPLVQPGGRVIAMDLLEMPGLAGVDFIHGDFSEEGAFSRLEALLGDQPVDLVLSDMAPNMSGVATVDQARAMGLAELALQFSQQRLRSGGNMVIKLFQGEGFDAFVKELRTYFDRVRVRKPEASRSRSREVFAVATGMKSASGRGDHE